MFCVRACVGVRPWAWACVLARVCLHVCVRVGARPTHQGSPGHIIDAFAFVVLDDEVWEDVLQYVALQPLVPGLVLDDLVLLRRYHEPFQKPAPRLPLPAVHRHH